MIKSEFHNAVKIELDKTSSFELPAFLPEEIDYWLYQSVLRISEEKYNTYLSEVDNPKVQDELKFLLINNASITLDTPVSSDPSIGRGKVYEISFNLTNGLANNFIYDLYIQLNNKLLEDGTLVTSVWQKCEKIKETDSFKYISSYFNTPYFEQPVYYLGGSSETNTTSTSLIIITDYFTSSIGSTIKVSYLKVPTDIATLEDTDEYVDLPSHMHHNIVKLAAFLMLENIESQRVQTNVNLVNNNL